VEKLTLQQRRTASFTNFKEQKARLDALKLAADAARVYKELTSVDSFNRTRFGKPETVRTHFKGLGPKKSVPNYPLPRLKSWLLAHGVKLENFGKAYALASSKDADYTTHDLVAAGLLDRQDYFDALNALPRGKRF